MGEGEEVIAPIPHSVLVIHLSFLSIDEPSTPLSSFYSS